jgi:hypothetical protein
MHRGILVFMGSFIRALLILTASAVSASAADVAGNWKVDFVSGDHKAISEARFEFKVDGNKLAGTAHVGRGFPGTAPITKGVIDGDHITFLVVGESPSSTGYPKMKFDGTIHENEIELTMLYYYSDESDSDKSQFKGKRVAP